MTFPAPLAADADAFIWWDWVWRRSDDVVDRTVQHLQLTFIAIGVGFVLALVLALVGIRWRRTLGPITWVTGLLYTIPSLALFALLVPVYGASLLTAEIALVSYTLLILVQNLVAGIDGVDPAVRDAADAMGYTRRRRLLTVELPLALPTIITGLRIATVTIIGLVTVTSLVGYGGYGAFILDGLNRNFSTPIVLGVGLSIALALAFDLIFVLLQRLATPWARKVGR